MKIDLKLEEKKLRISNLKAKITEVIIGEDSEEIEMAMLNILSDINYGRIKRKRK